jgi:suppressor of ftsI
MNRRRFLIGAAAATGAGVSFVADGCSSIIPRSAFIGPGHVLNVGYTTSNISGYKMRTRTYNGATAGPLIEAFPGTTLSITVNNQLPPNPAQSVPQQHGLEVPLFEDTGRARKSKMIGKRMATAAVDPMNNPNHFNTTNLHVHGIQTTPHLYNPIGTSDPSAMMIAIEPGSAFTYNLPIPADHPSGLYWYHPHHHGSTDVQVSGGMAGLIAVRGAIDQVPEIAAAREVFFVVQSLQVNPGPNGVYEYEPVPYALPQNGGYTGTTDYVMMTVNGEGVLWITQSGNTTEYTPLSVPSFQMRPGEVIRLRMLNGTNGTYLPIVLPGMEVYLIGTDGVNLPAPQKLTLDFTGQVTQFNINSAGTTALGTSPGNRVELLIKAPNTPGTYTMSSAAQNNIEVELPSIALANFVVSGEPVTMSIPASLPATPREAPIADSEIVNKRTITFHEAINQPAGFLTQLTGFWPWIDSAPFDEMTVDYNVKLGTAEEWTIVNGTMCGHPFHIHVNSFEVIAINGVPLSSPLTYDTFMVPPAQAPYSGNMVDGMTPPGTITIRIRFKEWTGKSVLHCHILNHEDIGMMKNIVIS